MNSATPFLLLVLMGQQIISDISINPFPERSLSVFIGDFEIKPGLMLLINNNGVR